jgi:hypothetical protein
MEKIDFKKTGELYKAKKEPAIIKVPKMNFIMIDGKGDPNNSIEFQNGVEVLFSLSYTLKFIIKKENEIDYGVLPLEGMWWSDNMEDFTSGNKSNWNWTLMIMQPEYVTKSLYGKALVKVKEKKELPAIDKARFESFNEGLSAQILHVGPFSAEGPTVQKLHDYIKDNGYKLTGKHREIYLSDFRKTAPEKLKTIIRQPVSR